MRPTKESVEAGGGGGGSPPRVHFSVDDVLPSLAEASAREIALFEQPFFAFLDALNREFGVPIDLYLFLEVDHEGRRCRLVEVADRLGKELVAASWIGLGPHAQDYHTKPYEQSPTQQQDTFAAIYAEIDRLAGPAARSRWLRLHYFSECYESAGFLREQGVRSLLLTDKDAVSWVLDEPARRELARRGSIEHAGLTVRRSFPRLERLVEERWDDRRLADEIGRRLADHGYVALFTHEVDVARPEVREMAGRCLHCALNAGACVS